MQFQVLLVGCLLWFTTTGLEEDVSVLETDSQYASKGQGG